MGPAVYVPLLFHPGTPAVLAVAQPSARIQILDAYSGALLASYSALPPDHITALPKPELQKLKVAGLHFLRSAEAAAAGDDGSSSYK